MINFFFIFMTLGVVTDDDSEKEGIKHQSRYHTLDRKHSVFMAMREILNSTEFADLLILLYDN